MKLKLIYTLTLYLSIELIQPLPKEQVRYKGEFVTDWVTLKTTEIK